MKNAVMIFVSVIVGILTLAVIMTILGRMNRSTELKSSLSTVMEKTVTHMMTENCQQTDTGGEVVAESMEMLSVATDADSGITLQVMKADLKKGILAVRVQEEFRQLNGSTGVEEWDRTILWDRCEIQEPEYFSVRFYRTKEEMNRGGNCYKKFLIRGGDRIRMPEEPGSAAEGFLGWKDVNDYIADSSLPVEQERVYYAQWG